VGYGDLKPRKPATKLVAVITAFFGLVFTGLMVALAIHAATSAINDYVDPEKYKVLEQKVKTREDEE